MKTKLIILLCYARGSPISAPTRSGFQGKDVRNRRGPQTRRGPRDLFTGKAESSLSFCFSVVRQKGRKRIAYGIFNIYKICLSGLVV
jgi:hypothetical protein